MSNAYFFQYLHFFGCAMSSCCMWDPVPSPGIRPGPPHWACEVLATGALEKSQKQRFKYR